MMHERKGMTLDEVEVRDAGLNRIVARALGMVLSGRDPGEVISETGLPHNWVRLELYQALLRKKFVDSKTARR